MRRWVAGAVVLAVLAVGAWWLARRGASDSALVGLAPSAVRVEGNASEPATSLTVDGAGGADEQPVFEPMSLPAFAKQEFDGRDFTVGRELADNEAYTRYYITYRSGELRISGIINVPKGEGPWPVLILNHGYIDPAVYTNGRGLKREQDYLARRGYVVIHPDYRNHAESDDDPETDRRFRLGYTEDVINAIHAVRAAQLPYADAERIGMLGHSMGGGIAWQIAVAQPDLVDAFVLFAPVSADARDNFEKWISRRPEVAQAIVATHGSPAENPAFWEAISPLTFFKDITAPVMIQHGAADESVPLAWSQSAAEALRAVGKDVTLHVYPGEPHEFIDAWPAVMERTAAFFDRRLAERSL